MLRKKVQLGRKQQTVSEKKCRPVFLFRLAPSPLCVHCKSTLKIDSTKRRVGFHFISKSLLIFQQPQIMLDLWSHFLKWIGRIFYQSLLIAIFSFAIKSGIILHSTLDFSSFSWINRILCRFKLLSHFPFLPSPSAIFFGQNVNGALKVSKTFSESLTMKESRCCFSQKESEELAVILQALMKTLGDR